MLTRKNLEAAFNAFDRDGSGTLSVEEVSRIFGNDNRARKMTWLNMI
jgi:Ca2+-binding EF-hand superfamily protein